MMSEAERKRRMKIDMYLSCSAARNSARQAAWMAQKKAEEESGQGLRRGAAAAYAVRKMHEDMGGSVAWGGSLFRRGIVIGGTRARQTRGQRGSSGILTALAILLVAFLVVVLFTGCGASDADKNAGSQNTEVNGADGQGGQTDEADGQGGQTDGTDEADGEDDADEASQFEIPDVTVVSREIPDTEAFAFVRDMKIGWCLGNTLDAYTDGGYANELDSETSWVSVATTKEMIDDIKEAGFNTIRVPVTWHGHFTDDQFTISQVWLDRVQEVVDYGINNGMYVILNIHHDTNEDCYYPDSAHLEQSVRYIRSIWTQLAARFSGYDEHLIFEGMNEPRLVGSKYEWWIDNNSQECIDAIECINTLNQVFVSAVRESGGNNLSRYLMVPGYDASPDGALHPSFAIPTDAEGVTDRIMISVHAYTPYNFALQAQSESGSRDTFDSDSADSTRDIDYFMDRLYDKFISQGIPVVIGEFGARDKDNNTQDRVDYAAYYIAAARARGMSCMWWDNGAFSGNGENFGLYYRRGGYFVYPDIVTALMKYAD